MRKRLFLPLALSLLLGLLPQGGASAVKQDAEKTVKVLNLPPIGDFEAKKDVTLDLDFLLRDTDKVSEFTLPDKINTFLRQPLAAAGITPNITVKSPTMVYEGNVFTDYMNSRFMTVQPDGSQWSFNEGVRNPDGTWRSLPQGYLSRIPNPKPASKMLDSPRMIAENRDGTLYVAAHPTEIRLQESLHAILSGMRSPIKKIVGKYSLLCLLEDGQVFYLRLLYDQSVPYYQLSPQSWSGFKDIFWGDGYYSSFYGLTNINELYALESNWHYVSQGELYTERLVTNVKEVTVDSSVGGYAAITEDNRLVVGGFTYYFYSAARVMPPTPVPGVTDAAFGPGMFYTIYNTTHTVGGDVVLQDRSTVLNWFMWVPQNTDPPTILTTRIPLDFQVKDKPTTFIVRDTTNALWHVNHHGPYSPGYNRRKLADSVDKYYVTDNYIVLQNRDGTLSYTDRNWFWDRSKQQNFGSFYPIKTDSPTGPDFSLKAPGPAQLQVALSELSYSHTNPTAVVDFSDGSFPELGDAAKSSAIKATLRDNSATLVGMGNAGNQSIYQNIIGQNNNNNGTFLDASNVDAALTQLANYLVDKFSPQKLNANAPQYTLLGETINFQAKYADPENDPWRDSQWNITQDPNSFENPTGTIPNNGGWTVGPLTRFDQVGKYEITMRVRDNPEDNNNFQNYWLWSNPSGKLTLYVHRKPIAQFVASSNQRAPNGNSIIAVTNISYDLDHSSLPNKGIVRSEWSWKRPTDPMWTSGRPNEIPPSETYLLRLRVQDLEGAWSDDAIQEVRNDNNLPPAMTITNPSGTPANPTIYNADPLVVWNYADAENNPQTAYALEFVYADTNSPALTVQMASGSHDYQVPNFTLKRGRVIQVSGFVSDGKWSERSNAVYFMIGQPKVTLNANPMQLYAGQSATLTATGQFLSPNQYIFLSDLNGANTLASGITSFYSDYRRGGTLSTTSALSATQRSVQYRSTVFDTWQNNTITSSNVVTIDWLGLPKVEIATSPAQIYEGDTVTVHVTSRDPNGFQDRIEVRKRNSDGTWSTIWSKNNVPASTTETFTLPASALETVILQAVITDPNGMTGTDSTTYTVLPLTVTGAVHHTPQWEHNRLEWNARGDVTARDSHVFWAGETFVLTADTTVPESFTQATSVTAQIVGTSYSTALTPDNAAHSTWSGSLWDESFEQFADQTLTFRFTAVWSNGTQKTCETDVVIAGSAYDYYRLHRRF